MKRIRNKSVLLVSQHLWGTGHLIRTAVIANAIANKLGYSVTHVSGGPPVSSFTHSSAVDFIQLPSVQPAGKFATGIQISGESGLSLIEVQQQRLAIINSLLAKKHFDAVITEFYPFAPERMADIAEPIISQLTRDAKSPTRFICSIRDIPFNGERKQYPKDALTTLQTRLRSFYDAVWHHTDPHVVNISMIPELAEALRDINIIPTGYILSPYKKRLAPAKEDGTKILVTVGGGRDGYEVIAPILNQLMTFSSQQVAEIHIVCGSLMPDEDVSRLRSIAKNRENIYVSKDVENLRPLIEYCSAVISMAGYNTVAEVVEMGRPLLLVPRIGIFEQEARAEAFAKAGLALVYWPSRPDNNLSDAIKALFTFHPRGVLDTNGAERSAQLLEEILEDTKAKT